MKKDMPLEGLRWSRDSGSALYDTPQTAVLGRAGGQFQLSKIVLSFLVGSQWMTSTYMGFHFLWFLPTMLMVIVVRDVYFNVSQSVKVLIILIAFGFWLLESLDISLGYWNYIPFNFVGSMKYILVGICARGLIEASFHYKYIGKIMVSIFVLASMVFGYLEYHELNQIYSLFSQVIKILIPISFAYIIVSCQKWGRFHVLRFLGKYSLQIYLFHVIISLIPQHYSLTLFISA